MGDDDTEFYSEAWEASDYERRRLYEEKSVMHSTMGVFFFFASLNKFLIFISCVLGHYTIHLFHLYHR